MPVGLLGLARKTSLVFGVTAAMMASTSVVKFFSGAITGLAPAASVLIG